MPSNSIKAITLGTFNSATLTANYQAVYAGGLPHSLTMLRIINKSNVDVLISYDGVTTNDYITAGDTLELPCQLISQPKNAVSQVPAGTVLSIKQATAPGIGNIYVSGYYNAA